jgi:hypothetical protein
MHRFHRHTGNSNSLLLLGRSAVNDGRG